MTQHKDMLRKQETKTNKCSQDGNVHQRIYFQTTSTALEDHENPNSWACAPFPSISTFQVLVNLKDFPHIFPHRDFPGNPAPTWRACGGVRRLRQLRGGAQPLLAPRLLGRRQARRQVLGFGGFGLAPGTRGEPGGAWGMGMGYGEFLDNIWLISG